MTSARMLGVILALTFLLSGCFDQSSKQTWDVEPEGGESTFGVPEQIQQKVEPENLRAEVQLNNGEWQPLIIEGANARGSLTGLEAGDYTLSIRFVYMSGIYNPLNIAQATRPVTIIAGSKTTLEVREEDYEFDLFDNDNDGFSNYKEISDGTNPQDSSDPGVAPPPPPPSSSEASSESSLASSSIPVIDSSSSSVASSSTDSTSSSLVSSSSSNGNIPQPMFSISAGENIEANEGDLVEISAEVLNAGGSVSYSWTTDTAGLDLQGANTDTLRFQAGNYATPQVIRFDLSVTSGTQTLTDDVVVTITATDEPPVLTFTATELTAAPNVPIELAPASVTDPEGESLTYTWEASLTNPVVVDLTVTDSVASFTTPALSSATDTLVLEFIFTAFDGEQSAEQTITVTVQDNNDVPVARITTVDDVTTVAENSSIVLSGLTSTDMYTASENLQYQWALDTDFAYDLGITDWNSPTLTVNAPNLAEDVTLQFSLVVTDDSTPALSSTPKTIDITIDAENNPAVLTLGRSAGSAEPGEQGIELTATAADPDLDQAGLTYTFEWLNPAGFDVLNATSGEQVTFDAPSDLLEDTDLVFTVNATQVGTNALPIDSSTIGVRIGGFAPPTAVAALANAMAAPSEAAEFDLTAAGSLNGTNPITSFSWSTDCDGELSNATAQIATFSPNNRAANDVCTFTVEVSDGTGEGTVSDTLNVTITAIDEPPVLAPLTQINTTANQPVSLNASAANDPEGTPLTFNWETTSGVTLTGADTPIASFDAPDSDEPQSLVFTVTITDGNSDNAIERTVTVEVAANNDAPVAVITSESDSVGENTPVTLSGETSNDTHTASDALSYQWEQISPTPAEFDLGINDWQSATLSFTSPDLAADRVVTFGLIVTDEQGTPSVQDTYALTLEGENSAPTVTVTASQNSVGAGSRVTLTATPANSDIDQQAINYTYNWAAPAGFESLLAGLSAAELVSNQITFTAPAESVQLVFSVTASEDITDGLTSEAATTTINVTVDYVPPVADITLIGGGSTITESVAATFSAAASQLGTDGPVTYAWTSTCPGQFAATDTIEVEFTADNLEASVDCDVTVAIDDQSGSAGIPVQATLPVTLSANNDAPVATGPAAPIAAMPNMPVALAGFTVSDADSIEAQLTYEWTADIAGAEAWLSDADTVMPTLLAPPSPANVSVIYTLRALDGGEAERTAAENATAVASVTVNIANNNDNPRAVISLVMPASVTDIGERMTVQLIAEPVVGETRFDNFSDASELTFTWTPSTELQALGAMPASAQGLVNYSFSLPNLEQPVAGLNVSLVIRDPDGGVSSTYDFPFAVTAENEPPSTPVISGPNEAVGNTEITLTASGSTDPEGLVVTYSWQEVDAMGAPVMGGVACETTTPTTCTFTAPDEDRTLIMQVIASDGVEKSSSTTMISISSSYTAWDFELVVASPPPQDQPGFDAIEEQAEIVIALAPKTQGSTPIQVYDWSESTCSYIAPIGQPFTNPTVSDFTIFDESAELRFAPITFVSQSYSCEIQLIIDDGQSAPISRELTVNVFADNDAAIAIAGVLISDIETDVESHTASGGEVISLVALEASDSDSPLNADDIYWEIVEPEYASLFDFSDINALSPTLKVPALPEVIAVTLRLNVGDVFDDIQLTVESSGRPFITRWNAIDGTVLIPTRASEYTYDYFVDWGDGSPIERFTGDAEHEYASLSEYTVKITGTFPAINFFARWFFTEKRQKLLSIEQWGDIEWKSMQNAFSGAENMSVAATDAPDLSAVSSVREMFSGVLGEFNDSVGSWQTTGVTDMYGMFNRAHGFDVDISKWDVSNVTSMQFMFRDASSFKGDLSGWDVSSVTHMTAMFSGASNFNGDVSGWNVSSVIDMQSMFDAASSFMGDLSSWDVSSVTNMGSMFNAASNFHGDLSRWDVTSVTNMGGMFSGASSFNGDLSDWNVSNVTNMQNMFAVTSSFNGDISDWDVSGVTNMGGMFYVASIFNGDISGWNVSNVTNMGWMFSKASNFNGDLSSWDVSNVTDMRSMFAIALSFNGDLSRWDVSGVADMWRMFEEASSFNGELSSWDLSSVTEMSRFFDFSGTSSQILDSTLIGWSQTKNATADPIIVGAKGLTLTSASLEARKILRDKNMFIDLGVDTDGDGVNDGLDFCDKSAVGAEVDDSGCSNAQLVNDGDGDGVADDVDQCPFTEAEAAVDSVGCTILNQPLENELDSSFIGNREGFYFDLWKDIGDVFYEFGVPGQLKLDWSENINEVVAGIGWKPVSNPEKVIQYSGRFDITSEQNAFFGLYGWSQNPLVEFYVVESYGSFDPSSCINGQSHGSYQSDGATYNIMECQRTNRPSIEGSSTTFKQYFSIRTPKASYGDISGTITVKNHFDAWVSNGLLLGDIERLLVSVNGYQSAGSADITVTEISSGPAIELSITEIEGFVGQGTTKIELLNMPGSGETVAYFSDNTHIATVDQAGNVSLVGEGTTNIQVTVSDSEGLPLQTFLISVNGVDYQGGNVSVPSSAFAEVGSQEFIDPVSEYSFNPVYDVALGDGVVYGVHQDRPESVYIFQTSLNGTVNFGDTLDGLYGVSAVRTIGDDLYVVSIDSGLENKIQRFDIGSRPLVPTLVEEFIAPVEQASAMGSDLFAISEKYVAWSHNQAGPPNGESKISIAKIGEPNTTIDFTPLNILQPKMKIEGGLLYLSGATLQASNEVASVWGYDLSNFPAEPVRLGVAAEREYRVGFVAKMFAIYKGYAFTDLFSIDPSDFQIIDITKPQDISESKTVYQGSFNALFEPNGFIHQEKLYFWDRNSVVRYDIAVPQNSFIDMAFNIERDRTQTCGIGDQCFVVNDSYLYLGFGDLQSFDIRGSLNAVPPTITSQLGSSIEINFSWGSSNAEHLLSFQCFASDDAICEVTALDPARRSGVATVTLPFVNDDQNPNGHYSVVVSGGSQAMHMSDQVLLRAAPAL